MKEKKASPIPVNDQPTQEITSSSYAPCFTSNAIKIDPTTSEKIEGEANTSTDGCREKQDSSAIEDNIENTIDLFAIVNNTEKCIVCSNPVHSISPYLGDVILLADLCSTLKFPSIIPLMEELHLPFQNSQFCDDCSSCITDCNIIHNQLKILEERLKNYKDKFKKSIREGSSKDPVESYTTNRVTGPVVRKMFVQCWSNCSVPVFRNPAQVLKNNAGENQQVVTEVKTPSSRRSSRKRKLKKFSGKDVSEEQENICESKYDDDDNDADFDPLEFLADFNTEPEVETDRLKSQAKQKKRRATFQNRPKQYAIRSATNEDGSQKPFICTECGSGFNQEQSYMGHMSRHRGEYPFECEFCGKKFALKRALLNHNRAIHNMSNFILSGSFCPFCRIEFESLFKQMDDDTASEKEPGTDKQNEKPVGTSKPQELGSSSVDPRWSLEKKRRDHIRTCSENPRAEDRVLKTQGKKWPRRMAGRSSAKNSDGSHKPYVCTECGSGFNQEISYIGHMNKHRGEFPFKCEHCDKKFALKRTLLIHNRDIHNISNTITSGSSCPYCRIDFVSLIKQIDIDTTSGQGTNEQNQEPALTNKSEGLQNSVVDVLWTVEKKRRHHVKTCSDNPRVRWKDMAGKIPCQHCDKLFSAYRNLDLHIAQAHNKTFKYFCELCGKGFQILTDLKRHVECVHEGEKKFECELCHKKYKRKHQLIYHRRRHTGDLPYVCEICGKSFIGPDKLTLHTKNVHSENLSYPCHLCGKVFRSHQYRHNHISTTHYGSRKGRVKSRKKATTSTPPSEAFIITSVTDEPNLPNPLHKHSEQQPELD